MATSDTMDAQRDYTRELLALGLGGLGAGLVTSGLGLIAQGHVGPLSVLSFGALLGLGASLLDHESGRSMLRLALGVIAGVAMALLLGVQALAAAALGGVFLGAAYSLEYGDSMAARVGLWLTYGLALAAGVFTSQTLLEVGFLSSLEQVPLLRELVQGGIWGAFLMVPTGVKYLEVDSDELIIEFKRARVGLDDRHAATLQSARETYGRIRDEIAREGQAEVRERSADIAAEIVRGLIELTRRSNELHQAVSRTQSRPLEVRARELEGRIRATRDAALKRELVAALGEVVEQMRARRRLETACARIEARQQRYLTALDRLHVTLVQNDSLSSTAGALNHSLDELARLTEEVHYKNLSVDDLVDSAFEDLEIDDELDTEDGIDEAELEALISEVHDLSVSREQGDGGLPRPHLPPRSRPPEEAPEEDEPVILDQGADGSLEDAACEDEEGGPQQGGPRTDEPDEDADVEQVATVSAASTHSR